jgi:hypothetical protein
MSLNDAQPIEYLRSPGQVLWFEYHCLESHDSCDAALWYRSQQRVTVLRLAPNDGYYPAGGVLPIPSFAERMECATPIAYSIRFADGFEADAVEDELLDSPLEFERPSPPKCPLCSTCGQPTLNGIAFVVTDSNSYCPKCGGRYERKRAVAQT